MTPCPKTLVICKVSMPKVPPRMETTLPNDIKRGVSRGTNCCNTKFLMSLFTISNKMFGWKWCMFSIDQVFLDGIWL